MRVILLALALTALVFALSVAGDLSGSPRKEAARAKIPVAAAESP